MIALPQCLEAYGSAGVAVEVVSEGEIGPLRALGAGGPHSGAYSALRLAKERSATAWVA